MPPKHKQPTAPRPVAQTPDDIAALAAPSTLVPAPTETTTSTSTSSMDTRTPTLTPTVTFAPPPDLVKEVTDTIIQSAAKPPTVSSAAVPIDRLVDQGKNDLARVNPPGPPTGILKKAEDPPAKAAVSPATMKPTNEQIATVRSILIRRIRKYEEHFKAETKDIIPSNINGLNNDQLAAICAACDSSLGDCFDRDAIAAMVFAILQGFESYGIPFIPGGEQFMGVSSVAEQMLAQEKSPLGRAMDRLAIKYIGTFETSAEFGLLISLFAAFRYTRDMNIQHGYYVPNQAPSHKSTKAEPVINYDMGSL